METYPREAGAPHAELRTFTLYEPGAICVLVESRSVSSARIGLDSTTLVSPDELSPQVHRLTAFANLAAGEHELSVELASGPGHQLEVEVRFARTDVTLSGGVEGAKGKLVVGALASEPDPFTPANHNGIRDVTNLNAMVKVLQLTGGPHHTYFLGYAFEIADPVSCSPVRLLAGQVPLDPTHRLAGIPVAAEWDGKDEEGNLLPDGTYYFQTRVSLVRQNPGVGVEELDFATSLVGTVALSSDPAVDEQAQEDLEEVPFEVGQALAASLEEDEVPLELEEPRGKSPPYGDEEGDGGQGAFCYPAEDCDSDGDGYAWESNDRAHPCFGTGLEASETGGKGLCPDGWVQYTEPSECNEIVTDDDEEAFWIYRTRSYLRESWAGILLVEGAWISSYGQHHPRRAEMAGNFLDDNCDGFVDETRFVYKEKGSSPAPGQLEILALINDKKIRQHANVIGVHVYDLASIECPGWPASPLEACRNPAILAMRAGKSRYSYPVGDVAFTGQLPSPIARRFFWYQGDSQVSVHLTNLALDLKVYAISLTYHHVTFASLDPLDMDDWQLKCVHAVDGSVNDSDACTFANRIASDVYFTALGDESSGEQRLRALVANRAIHEWWQSEQLGHVGGPRSAHALHPDGTRYHADYGELWCTEFTAAIYRWTVQDSWPFGFATNVDDMVGYFGNNGWLDEGEQVRYSMCVLADPSGYGSLGPAMPGDYLALANSSSDTKKHHSAIFLTNSHWNHNWKIGGNEERRVKMKCGGNFQQLPDPGGQHYVFQALGHIRHMPPMNGNP
jgi:hypothetical protein